ncbi:MAG TPA: PilX N-terminal domain-containing pilus assembly protein [Steroidobacteraceae bacterium]
MNSSQRGATLAVGLILLTLVTLLGLAGASAAHVERLLAQDEAFRENAANAAGAGIEMAIRAIVNSSDPAGVPTRLAARMPGSADAYEVTVRFAGYEQALPQAPGSHLAGAHFEMVSTGTSARHSIDRQRADVLWVVDSSDAIPADCAPVVARRCHARGELERVSWQRIAAR